MARARKRSRKAAEAAAWFAEGDLEAGEPAEPAEDRGDVEGRPEDVAEPSVEPACKQPKKAKVRRSRVLDLDAPQPSDAHMPPAALGYLHAPPLYAAPCSPRFVTCELNFNALC